MKMSVTRALAELKLLDKRISKEISNLSPANAVVKTELDSAASKEFKDKVDAKLDQITQLIENTYKIKGAIIQSNATTSVKIGDETMTVAEAIAKKDLLNLERDLYAKLRTSTTYYTNQAENSEVQARAKGEQIAAALAGEDKTMFDQVYKSYMDQNTTALLISDKVVKFKDNLDEAIDKFESEVDFVLSESNTRTTIDVEL